MSKKIEELDKNFKIEASIDREGIVFYDAKVEPFTVHGLMREDGKYVRIPYAVAKTVNKTVESLYRHTAGGRVRFVTDSPYVAIKSIQPKWGIFPHMAPTGQTGFDMYVGNVYYKTFIPPAVNDGGYESVQDFPDSKKRLITINFPLYYNVDELYIGLKEGCLLEKAPDYTISKPIVYYGSSITQGGCASRAGTSYQGFISRRFDADYINLGFSGSAFGEETIADYIADLDMSIFVSDYDYNAITLADLEATHERLFLKVREKHPDMPIVIVSHPGYFFTDEDPRFKIVKRTYENAIARGDKNVYYVPGNELMALCENEGTVDALHPTDLGFFSMAQRIGDELAKILNQGVREETFRTVAP